MSARDPRDLNAIWIRNSGYYARSVEQSDVTRFDYDKMRTRGSAFTNFNGYSCSRNLDLRVR
jgi:hypothetical protein